MRDKTKESKFKKTEKKLNELCSKTIFGNGVKGEIPTQANWNNLMHKLIMSDSNT